MSYRAAYIAGLVSELIYAITWVAPGEAWGLFGLGGFALLVLGMWHDPCLEAEDHNGSPGRDRT